MKGVLGLKPKKMRMVKFNKKKVMSAAIATAMALSVCTGLLNETFNELSPSITVYAEDSDILNSGICGDNLTWTLSSYGQLTISGTGNMYDYSSSNLPEWHNNWQQITSLVVNSGVTSIGEFAFYKSHVLTSVSLPNTLTNIKSYALAECTSLTNITIPDSVTTIGDWGIASCGLLTDVYMSNNVTYLGDSAFIDCVNLKYINLPDCISYIGNNAFRFCENLTSVNIPKNLTSLSIGTFSGCKKLNKVAIPYGITSIGNFAFYECKKITEISIPDSVSSMGYSVFYKCSELTKVTIPASITYVDGSNFRECDNIRDVYYLGSREQWESISIRSGNESLLNANIHFAIEFSDYTVYFDPNGGYCITSSLKTSNGKLASLPTATRNGYTFEGWYTSANGGSEITTSTSFSSSTTVYAHWTEDEYTVTFNANGGNCSISSDRTKGGKLTILPTATRTGYIFDGWYNSASGGMKVTTSTSFSYNTIVYAHWISAEFMVTFNANGGNCDTSSSQTSNHKLSYLPTATRSGYKFDGWYTSASGGSKATTSTTFSCNTTIYAHWISNEYTVTFNANGGSCSTSSMQTASHKLSSLPTATKANCTFAGWYTSASGGTKILTATVFSYDTTVYAHWSEINGDVAFFSKTVAGGTKSTNIQKYGYNGTYYASPIRSYLYESNGYLNRLEYTGTNVILEKYNSSFNLLGKTTIEKELPIFGGFYAGADYNFILFGQKNSDEKNDIEIMKVVKYTKDMKRVDSKSFYGCNTYIPFDAGCPRMDEYNGVLYIHTSHEMYKSSDGYHHQSNMDFFIRISDMETLYSRYGVSYAGTGYMSHSFNQFIKVNGNGIYTVDHGDAYNRAITAFKRKSVTSSSVSYKDVFDIKGSIGQNYTGVCIGGMELSDDNMLIAGTSVPQDSTWGKTKQKNLFIIRKSLSGNESITVTYLTNYSEGSNVTFSEPKLVKINDNKFMLLWSETVSSQTKLYATLLDGSGKKIGKTFSCEGSVSDCQPIIYNRKVTFYVTNNSAPTFYYSS